MDLLSSVWSKVPLALGMAHLAAGQEMLGLGMRCQAAKALPLTVSSNEFVTLGMDRPAAVQVAARHQGVVGLPPILRLLAPIATLLVAGH